MKSFIKTLSLFSFVLIVQAAQAHFMWIEAPNTGKVGKPQTINVFFGEYTYGVIEDPKGDHFEAVKNFTLSVISPSGKTTEIATTITEKGYSGSFTPQEKGVYTAVLNNNEIDVIDYTKYDFGIFKTHYHSTAKITISESGVYEEATNEAGLAVVNLSTADVKAGVEQKIQVFYQGEPLEEAEVSLFMQDLWTKKMTTDENGIISFTLPFDTKYIVEVTKKEEVPGTYKGEDYEFIWHCATYCLDTTK